MMKVGDLVRMKASARLGIVERVDKQFYGASTAYKVSEVDRGKCIRPNMVDFVGVTADGIRDRVMVCWTDGDGWPTLEDSRNLEVVNE